MRARYRSADAVAAGAWTWTSPDGRVFVLADVQSTVPGIVQARADLWVAADSAVSLLGRSDAEPSAAEIGAWAFEDLTGDGLPDLFGYVADSSGMRYPVFLPGARGALAEQIAAAAPGWRFDVEDEHLPQVVRAGGVPCALQLWAVEGAPDGGPEGWRWLTIQRTGQLAPPVATEPSCEQAPGTTPATLQPGRSRP